MGRYRRIRPDCRSSLLQSSQNPAWKVQAKLHSVFSGKKETDKVYTRYTGYPGGQRFNTPAELRKRPFGADRIIRHAVKGMLPKGPLGRSLLDNLYIFDGTEHNMQAQKPKAIDINQYK